MGRWLSRLRQDEKNHETLIGVPDKTDETPIAAGSVSFVSPSVQHIREFIPEPAPPPPTSSVSFVSSDMEPAREFSPPTVPAPREGFVSSVSSPQGRKQGFFLEADRSGWDGEDWQAAYEERAAALEYDEGLPRTEAEALAREWVIGEIERAARHTDEHLIMEEHA